MPGHIPKVILGKPARYTLKSGFDQIARLLALTLGPTQGMVLHSTALKPSPEPVLDAATIARRITELPHRGQDVGAMLLRSLVWRVHQRVGDGSATTAVLAQAILEHASRYVVAGANPVAVQHGIEIAAQRAIEGLRAMSLPVTSQEQLASLAYTAIQEPEMSFLLSELYDLLGQHAHVTIEDYVAPYLEREYINGGLWRAKLISPYLISDTTRGSAAGTNANVVLFHGSLTQAEEVLPVIRALSERASKDLLLVAHKISAEALTTLVGTYAQNKSKQKLNFVLVDLTRAGEKALNDLQDLSLLTGARLFNPQAGDRIEAIQPSDFGLAHRAEANSEQLYVAGGKGSPAALREQISALHRYLAGLPFDDSQVEELQMRLGRLSGSSGILKIGAYSKKEREVLHQKAGQGVQVLHAARQAGFLPGGGTAFLHCIPLIEEIDYGHEDERLGCQAVARALRRPFEQLLHNAGVANAGSLAFDITRASPGLVYDLGQGKLLPAQQAGVLDAAAVLITSLETASSGARMALSTDAIVLKRKPRISYEP